MTKTKEGLLKVETKTSEANSLQIFRYLISKFFTIWLIPRQTLLFDESFENHENFQKPLENLEDFPGKLIETAGEI